MYQSELPPQMLNELIVALEKRIVCGRRGFEKILQLVVESVMPREFVWKPAISNRSLC